MPPIASTGKSAGVTIMTLDHVSRACGLAQSLEHPMPGVDLPPGARAVASEIVLLLHLVRDDLLAEMPTSSFRGRP